MDSQKPINGHHPLLQSQHEIKDAAGPAEQAPAPECSYNISIQPVQARHGKVVRIVLTFAKPENLAGQEYASFMLPYAAAGIFARKIESARKFCK